MIKSSIAEVSRVTGKSARHIRNLCKDGKLPCSKIKISTGEKYMIYLRTPAFKELFGDIPLSSFNEYEEDDILIQDGVEFDSKSVSFGGSPASIQGDIGHSFVIQEEEVPLPSPPPSFLASEEQTSFPPQSKEEESMPSNATISQDIQLQIGAIVENLTQRIEYLAKEAGKTELLTDNLMSSNENVKFYQDEYFKIKHELEIRTNELFQAKERIKELEEKLNRPFWRRF